MTTILITGAGGKTGGALLEALASRGGRTRAWVRREEARAGASAGGATETVVGDLLDAGVWAEAVCGVDVVYHIPPNMSPHEEAMAALGVRAAEEAGVRRFVYHSVLHPQTEEMPHHWRKMRVEEALWRTSLEVTILQPAAYMQNVLAGWEGIVREGVYRVPYAVGTRLGMVDARDVAAAAARVLTEDGYGGGTYELGGPEVLTQEEVAGVLSVALGKRVRAEEVDRQTWEAGARAAGMGEYAVGTLRAMFEYYERYGFYGNPRVLDLLLDRPASRFEEFVRDVCRVGEASG